MPDCHRPTHLRCGYRISIFGSPAVHHPVLLQPAIPFPDRFSVPVPVQGLPPAPAEFHFQWNRMSALHVLRPVQTALPWKASFPPLSPVLPPVHCSCRQSFSGKHAQHLTSPSLLHHSMLPSLLSDVRSSSPLPELPGRLPEGTDPVTIFQNEIRRRIPYPNVPVLRMPVQWHHKDHLSVF